MTKKKKSQLPVVTDIPLKNTDTPLVIDLPDGQKLVIGKLTTGSVIEVATWRGTGRPDSRTSRLMLGMNDATTISQTPVDTKSPDSSSVEANADSELRTGKKIFTKIVVSAIEVTTKALNSIKSLPKSFASIKKPGKVILAKGYSQEPEAIEDEVSEWLNQITARAQAQHQRKVEIEKRKATRKEPVNKAAVKKSPPKSAKKAAPRKKAR